MSVTDLYKLEPSHGHNFTEPLLQSTGNDFYNGGSRRSDHIAQIIDTISRGTGSISTLRSTASVMVKKLPILMTSVSLAGSVIGMGNLEFPYFMKEWGFNITMLMFFMVFYLMYTSC